MTDDELNTSNSTDNESVTDNQSADIRWRDDKAEKELSASNGSRYVSADKRRLIVQLATDGLSVPEIAMLADVTPSQAKRWAMRGRELATQRADSIIVQRIANQSTISQRLGGYAEESALKILKRINETIDKTEDIGKLSAALKTLVQIADGNKVTTTISQTVSRLRGRGITNRADVVNEFTAKNYTDSGYRRATINNMPTANDTPPQEYSAEDTDTD